MSNNENHTAPAKGQFLVYRAEDGKLKIDVRFEEESVWLTQQHMAELFQTTQQNTSQHILNIYDEGELQTEATHKKFLLVRKEGNREAKRQLDTFLAINDRDILNHASKISHELAKQQTEAEYDRFQTQRIQQSDEALSGLEQVIKLQYLVNKQENGNAGA